jgi:hypothetical protein
MEVVHQRIFTLAENLFPVAAWVRMRSMLRAKERQEIRIGAIGHGLETILTASVKDTRFLEGLEDFMSGVASEIGSPPAVANCRTAEAAVKPFRWANLDPGRLSLAKVPDRLG